VKRRVVEKRKPRLLGKFSSRREETPIVQELTAASSSDYFETGKSDDGTAVRPK